MAVDNFYSCIRFFYKGRCLGSGKKKAPISQGFDWCGKRDLNPHEDKASTDFKSVVSTIPPYPRTDESFNTTRNPQMKRVFLIFSAFFLTSCVSSEFRSDTNCPINSGGTSYSVLFEYGSAEMNENATEQLRKIAGSAKNNNDFVCLLGRLSYSGSASDQALGALDRAKSVAKVFLQEGVDLRKIYIGMAPQQAQTGLSQPLNAKEEKHTLEILIGK